MLYAALKRGPGDGGYWGPKTRTTHPWAQARDQRRPGYAALRLVSARSSLQPGYYERGIHRKITLGPSLTNWHPQLYEELMLRKGLPLPS